MSREAFLNEIQVSRIVSERVDGRPGRNGRSYSRNGGAASSSYNNNHRRFQRHSAGGRWRSRRSIAASWRTPHLSPQESAKRKRETYASAEHGDRRRGSADDALSSPTHGANSDVKEVLLDDWLYKTSRQKRPGLVRGPHDHRQHRRFQLTEHSLEYFQAFQRVKVSKQFPLTSIEKIEYDASENPVVFKLIFHKAEVLLEAPDKAACKLWVTTITREWEKWNPVLSKNQAGHTELGESTSVIGDAGARGSYLNENQGYFRTESEIQQVVSPQQVASPQQVVTPLAGRNSITRIDICPEEDLTIQRRGGKKYIRRETDVSMDVQKLEPKYAAFLGFAPRLERSEWNEFQNKITGVSGGDYAILHTANFVMIKYPRNSRSIPHERVFTMDFENLLLMWRSTQYSKF